jgi:hypothetical protein
MTIQELSKLAISNENTPELGQYWQKRYEKFLKNNVFILSEKTETLLEQKEPIDLPVTPYGYLNLPIFLGKNKVVDEVMLQNCIETAIRFLDSLLDAINFTEEAGHLINQNRKIGLGIVNFEEYLANRETLSMVEEIDYIGEIISSSSYRASEALAEEKGPCDSWSNLALIIRPKPFEYWYNSETGEVKSGLDIAEEFTSTNLLSSHFEIIPRRNSHILLYPNDHEWQIWSDRDENSIITNNLLSQTKVSELPIIPTSQGDDNNYNPSFGAEAFNNETEKNPSNQNEDSINNSSVGKPEIKQKTETFINPPPIDDLPLVNPISTLQQKISKWFAIDSNEKNESENVAPINAFDLSKDSEVMEKTDNDLPIPKQVKQEPQIITEIKEVEVIKEIPVEVIKEIEILKEINKPILVQVVTLSDEAKKILVDTNNQLPIVEYCFDKEVEVEVKDKINKKFGVQIDFMEISSVDFFEGQIYVAYQARIQEIQDNNQNLHFDFIEALNREQDIIAFSKSIDKIHRWQQSSKIKAQELLEEYNENIQTQNNENESKIITQKNLFIEELQNRIQKLIKENNEIEVEKNTKIENLNNEIETTKLELKESVDKSAIIEATLKQNQLSDSLKKEANSDFEAEVTLIKNNDLMFDLNSQNTSNQNSIPTININTNTMHQNQDDQSQVYSNQATFRTSRDKMFMPTLEIETKLGVPIIVHSTKDDDDKTDDQSDFVQTTDPKSSSHAANVLLKLKRLTR